MLFFLGYLLLMSLSFVFIMFLVVEALNEIEELKEWMNDNDK